MGNENSSTEVPIALVNSRAANAPGYESDVYNEFGLHLLDGVDSLDYRSACLDRCPRSRYAPTRHLAPYGASGSPASTSLTSEVNVTGMGSVTDPV